MDVMTFESRLSQYAGLAGSRRLMPVKVSAFYRRKLDEEAGVLGHREGPLNRLMYPSLDRLTLNDAAEVEDHVQDRSNMPEGFEGRLIHKYPDRLLFMPTEQCLSNCLYCFRQDVLNDGWRNKTPATEDGFLQRVVGYISHHPAITELIFSGGDPLMLKDEAFAKLVDHFSGLQQLRSLRLHTRAPIFDPRSLTPSKMETLRRGRVRTVLHIVHPYELCAQVRERLRLAQEIGVRLYNQFPMLRGVNDHVEVLKHLLVDLDVLDIRNLSVFYPEPVLHSACYRVRLGRFFELARRLRLESPAWNHATRFCVDTAIGKVTIEDRVQEDSSAEVYHFERAGRRMVMKDLPPGMDIPGKIETMLWRD